MRRRKEEGERQWGKVVCVRERGMASEKDRDKQREREADRQI